MKDVWQLKAVIPKKTLLQMWLQVVFKCRFADDAGIMLGKVWSTYEKWPADDQTVAYKQEQMQCTRKKECSILYNAQRALWRDRLGKMLLKEMEYNLWQCKRKPQMNALLKLTWSLQSAASSQLTCCLTLPSALACSQKIWSAILVSACR